MKRITALIAGLLLAGMVMTSCGGSIQLPPSETTAATTPASGETGAESTDSPMPEESTKPSETQTPVDTTIPADSDHTHTFYGHWSSDENGHWHDASCGHDVKDGAAAHVDENGDDVCDICGHRKDHVHTYEDAWTISERTHYHKNTCGHDDVEKYRKDEARHADENNDGLCDVCSYDYGHTHEYDTENWVKTENGHWHVPTCGHDVPGIDLSEHVDADNNGICDGCGYDYDHTHTWSEEWSHDEDYHWRDVTCGHTIDVADKNAHVSEDGDKICDVCSYEPPHIHEFDTSKWQSDANGHWHASSCGHNVRKDETGHDGYEVDGVCDTCSYVVFRFYNVTVTLPEESVSIKAPDGSDSLMFVAKEGTDVVFHLSLPRYIEIINMKGATLSEKSVVEGDNHTYTVTVKAIKGDTDVSMELKKNSNVQVVVDYAEVMLEVANKFVNVNGQITFNIPSAGRYIIYADNSDVKFSLAGNTAPQDDTSNAYIFDAPAGEITIDCSYFPWSVPENNQLIFHYVVARVEKNTTLDSLEGNGCIMPTNYAVNISFRLPSAGFYQIISSSQVSWDFDITQPHFFYVPEGGDLERTIAIKYDSETEAQFIFDWKIEKVTPVGDLRLGNNAFVAQKGAYSALTFTAPRDGNYFFTTGDSQATFYHWVETEWGDYLQRFGANGVATELTQGQTITLFVIVDPHATEEEIPASVNCNGYVSYAPVRNEEGFYQAVPGIDNAFVSNEYEDVEYTLTASNGDLISIDGGQTWHDDVIALVPGSGALYYQVKSASGNGIVSIAIGKTSYEFDLPLNQTTTVDMIPGQEYVIHLTGGQGHYVDYTLSWTDANISVTYGSSTITSGGTIALYSSGTSSLVAVYNGSSEATVSFTVGGGTPSGEEPGGSDNPDDSNPDDPDISGDIQLVLGRQQIEITDGYHGVTLVFKAPAAGTYKFAFATGETNGVAIVESEYAAEELTMPYSVVLAEGETFTFILSTLNYEPDTIGLSISKS